MFALKLLASLILGRETEASFSKYMRHWLMWESSGLISSFCFPLWVSPFFALPGLQLGLWLFWEVEALSQGSRRSAVGRCCKSVSSRQDIRLGLGSCILSETFPLIAWVSHPLLAVPLFERLSSEGSDSCHHGQSPAKTDRRKRATW